VNVEINEVINFTSVERSVYSVYMNQRLTVSCEKQTRTILGLLTLVAEGETLISREMRREMVTYFLVVLLATLASLSVRTS